MPLVWAIRRLALSSPRASATLAGRQTTPMISRVEITMGLAKLSDCPIVGLAGVSISRRFLRSPRAFSG